MTDDASEHQLDPALERYLDGLLDDTERRAFEERLNVDVRLREEVARQRQVDRSLHRLFGTAPELTRIDQALEQGRWRTRRSAIRRRAWMTAALIALSIVALGRWLMFSSERRPDPYAPQAWRSMETVYRDVALTKFRGTHVGSSNERLSRLIERRFHQPLAFRESTGSVTPQGLGFCNTITDSTACLIAHVTTEAPPRNAPLIDEQTVGVLVFVDLADADATMAMPTEPGLHVYRRILGRLALYEVSPLDHPVVLDLLHTPEPVDR